MKTHVACYFYATHTVLTHHVILNAIHEGLGVQHLNFDILPDFSAF